MNIVEMIRKYKYPLMVVLVLLVVFGNQSTCNGITGYGFCSSDNGKVTHYSPLNLLS